MGYPRLIYLLEQIIFEGRDQIARDFLELGYSQSNKNLPLRFSSKLIEIASGKILDKAEKIATRQGLILNNNIIKESREHDYIVISVLPEEQNLLRALPFISCSIMSAKLDEDLTPQTISAAAILNPLTNQFYWTDTDNQARENFRKISTSKVIEIHQASNLKLNSANIELCWLASGKIDCLEISYNNFLDIAAAELIARKAGAKSLIDKNNKTIKLAANQELLSCLK